ncbi:pyridoxamine 5'-phosphate oxidase family protein [Streptomyces sp. NPDC020362]|uniref:pyridoxamine 5'-phosphate oxidase family protein n=1 Tax=unclassified Streptomyces TaxID=2593676 RepID=UPI000A56D43E
MILNGPPAHRRIELDRLEVLRLLGSVSPGRTVLTRQDLPTVRPVNDVLDGGDTVIRTRDCAALTPRAQQSDGAGVVVAHEADPIAPDTHLGWSVVVMGHARPVGDPGELARIRGLLHPWAPHPGMDYAVHIRPDLVTGVLLTRTGSDTEERRPP